MNMPKERSYLVNQKIDELIELAKLEDELAVASILLALRGARCMDADGLLSNHVAEFLKSTLMPMAEQGKHDQLANKN